jgi:curved DNA-binding protein CbpA
VSDLYQVLGVKRAATPEEIQRAYRRKAKTSHPDGGGSVEAFSEIATAYAVLSDAKRREKYDRTGEIEPPRSNTIDASAIEIIAQKLGLIIHAEQDVTSMDIGVVIEQSIRSDIAERKTDISRLKRAIERTARLRDRVRRKANGGSNSLAGVLDWHEAATKGHIKKNEDAVNSLERALEILEDYSFTNGAQMAAANEVSVALHDALQALDELAGILNTGHRVAEAAARDAAPSAFG